MWEEEKTRKNFKFAISIIQNCMFMNCFVLFLKFTCKMHYIMYFDIQSIIFQISFLISIYHGCNIASYIVRTLSALTMIVIHSSLYLIIYTKVRNFYNSLSKYFHHNLREIRIKFHKIKEKFIILPQESIFELLKYFF